METARRILWIPLWRELILSVFLLVILGIAWGCGGPPKKPVKQETGSIFYPLPPDKPRIQYLTSFTTSLDIGEVQSGFASFVLGKESQEVKIITKPFGVAAHDGVIYVADIRQNALIKLDLKQKVFDTFRGNGLGRLRKPIGIFIDADGTKYVTDIGRRQVVVFSPDDRFKIALGDGKDGKPADAVVSGNRVYVSDMEGHNIHVYDKQDGKLLFTFGGPGAEEGQFNKPTNLAVGSEGNIYVSDLINTRIQKFDRDGNLLMTFGQSGDTFGSFARPKGVAVDRGGNIYVVDAAFENVQIFDREGKLLMFFGGGGNEPGSMFLPANVSIDYDLVPFFQKYAHKDFEVQHVILVTNQFGRHRVNVYGFGALKE